VEDLGVSDDRSADDAADREERPEDRTAGTDAPRPASAAARRERRGDLTRPAGRAERTGRAAVSRERSARPDRERTGSPAARLVRFLREVIAELHKVLWPTRKQLVTYTAVVLVFVVFMVAFVALVDLGFQRVVFSVFG